MKKLLPLSIYAACVTALAAMTGPASAQSIPTGRNAFDKSGCQACHAYSSRRGAPSVRDMLAQFEGEPEKALKAIDQTEKHAADLMTGKISVTAIRSIAEWISGAELEDPEESATDTVKPASTAIPPTATAPKPLPAPVAVAPAPVKAVAEPATPLPRRIASASVTGIQVEPGSTSDRLTINLGGAATGDIDMRSEDGALFVRLAGTALAAAVPETIEGSASNRAVGRITASDEGDTLVLKVSPSKGDLKHSAMQLRNRLVIELTSVPSKRKPVPVVVAAKQPAQEPAPKAAPVKPAPLPAKAPVIAATPVAKPAMPKAEAEPAKPSVTEEKTKRDAEQKAKSDAQALAKKEAETKARREAEAQAAAKKEADAKLAAAQKKDSEAKAKQEMGDAARKEAELMAALKASTDALKGASAPGTGSTGDEKSAKRDRSKLKAPDKFRDEACPPIGQSDPIGAVDEARAKDIIERVGCPQCHAFVQKKTGPPFKRVFEKVKGNPSCVVERLKKNKEHREEGVTDDLKGAEFKIVADYLATRAK